MRTVEVTSAPCHTILRACAIADDDLSRLKVQVFDAQPDAFHQSQATPMGWGLPEGGIESILGLTIGI